MYTHTPAQTYCFDSFWALERASQSKTHWSQWKNSSSLQWALDPAHTTATNDRESVINNYDIPHRYRKDICPKSWDFFFFFACATINKGRFILPGNFQRGGSKSHPAAAYFQRKPVHTVILMSDPKISAEFFQSTSSLAQRSRAPCKSAAPFLQLQRRHR